MNKLEKFEKFLQSVNLESYRKQYSSIQIVEMDLPKIIQAIRLLYEIYWTKSQFISFDDFYKRYITEKKGEVEKFRLKSTMCKDCFYRGIKARIYRTWAGLITQIHAGYVAQVVFAGGKVEMSAELDSQGADIRVEYKKHFLNYQVKKTSYSGVKSGRPLPRKSRLEGRAIDIKYEVPSVLSDPKTKKGEHRAAYVRFLADKRIRAFKNGFVVFNSYVFEVTKKQIDSRNEVE